MVDKAPSEFHSVWSRCQQLAHVCKSLLLSASHCFCLHPRQKWARSSKAKECLGGSAAQQPRKVGGHCFLDMFCMYLRNRISWSGIKGPKGQAQGLHTGSGVCTWWALHYFDISLSCCTISIPAIGLRWTEHHLCRKSNTTLPSLFWNTKSYSAFVSQPLVINICFLLVVFSLLFVQRNTAFYSLFIYQ